MFRVGGAGGLELGRWRGGGTFVGGVDVDSTFTQIRTLGARPVLRDVRHAWKAEAHPYFGFGVDWVVGDWVAQVLEMYTDLMG